MYMKSLLCSLVCMFVLIAAPVNAMSLDEAKNAGYVGEQLDGFLGIVKTDSKGEVNSLVSRINAKRLQKYKELAGKNGTDVNAVGKVTASKVISKMPSGHFYKSSSGKWVKK